jgi:hypothetical protein
MTGSLNIGELARIAKAALDATTNGQEFMLEDVYNVTRAAYERYPEDPVIRQVASTIEKMAEKAPPGEIINQSQISEIHNHFVRLSGESKFRDILGHLLLNKKADFSSRNQDYTRMNRIDAEDSHITTDDMTNPNLVNALTSVFGGSIDSIKAFDQRIAQDGIGFVSAELQALGQKDYDVEIMGGDPNIIVYAAHFNTRKGRVTVAIPTEIRDNRVLFPSTFVANTHLKELTQNNLEYFIDAKSESNDFSVPKASDVLTVVGILTGYTKMAATDDEMRTNIEGLFEDADKDIDMNVPNLFVNREYEEGRPNIDTTQNVEMPQELAHLARDFEDDILEAASIFGMDTIRKGKEMVAKELISAGFKNAQVKFGSESGDSVVYLATINTPKGPAEIEVPIEMQAVAGDKYLPLLPTYFAYDGLVEDFTTYKLQRFAISLPAPSSSNISCSTAFSYMTLPELKDEILKAASDKDYVTCEAVLGEIEDKFPEEDFKNAVADYHYILMQQANLENNEQKSCSKMIPAGQGSIYPRCGHFGVPMHKVVVGEDGNCRLRTAVEREKLNPSNESGAAMSSAKIFMA